MASRRIPASTWREHVVQWHGSATPAREYAEQQWHSVERADIAAGRLVCVLEGWDALAPRYFL